MPKFRLRIWCEQILFDCNDYTVTADTLEEAVELLQEKQEDADYESRRQTHPSIDEKIVQLEPEEIIEGYAGITLIDAYGKRVRDLEGIPTGCARVGDPLEGPLACEKRIMQRIADITAEPQSSVRDILDFLRSAKVS